MKNMKKLMLFSIFLNLIYLTCVISYGKGGSYQVGTNTVYRDIVFRLEVQDSLLIVPESADLDFGEILKGSTETRKGETTIKVKGGKDVTTVKASYVDGAVVKNGEKMIKIKHQEEKPSTKRALNESKVVTDNGEVEEINVYFLPFEQSYELKEVTDGREGDIPVKAEIRGIGNAKLGKYKGNIKVNVEVVTKNILKEEEIGRW